MSTTKSQDVVVIIANPAFRERVRVLLRRHCAAMVKLAYPVEGGEGTPEQLQAAKDSVLAVRLITNEENKLRDACYDLLSEYPQAIGSSNQGEELTDAAILQIIAYGVTVWAKAEAIE